MPEPVQEQLLEIGLAADKLAQVVICNLVDPGRQVEMVGKDPRGALSERGLLIDAQRPSNRASRPRAFREPQSVEPRGALRGREAQNSRRAGPGGVWAYDSRLVKLQSATRTRRDYWKQLKVADMYFLSLHLGEMGTPCVTV
jgi:hypothetical protein